MVVLLAAQLTGLPWLGLQAVSKARQTYRNVRASGLAAALKQVPKGKGNCRMCKKIKLAKARQDQQQRANGSLAGWQAPSAPAVLAQPLILCAVAGDTDFLRDATLAWVSRVESPPTPPPRLI
jgi:hypothetical protein